MPRSTAPGEKGQIVWGTLEGNTVVEMEGLFPFYVGYMLKLGRRVALEEKIVCHQGVFVAVAGPNLETRAEYRFLRMIGADVVGMSTVPEVIVGVHAGLRNLGLSVITDQCLPDA